MATDATLTRVMAILGAAYPEREIQVETVEVYSLMLADILDDVLVLAAETHTASSKWFPKVSELREAAFAIQAKASGLLLPEEAWEEIMQKVRADGYYGTPEFSHPLIQRSVDGLGGWKTLCASETGMADRAHFLRIYTGLMQRHKEDVSMLPEVRAAVEALRMDGVKRLKGGERELGRLS